MKTIWIINQYAAPPQYEVRVRNNMMAHYLIEKGYNVHIISASTIHNSNINLINSNDKYIKATYDDLSFYHIKTSNYSGNGISRVKAMFEFPFKLTTLYKKIEDKPDLIICDLDAIFFPFAKYVAKKLRCPIYLEVRDLWPASIGVYKNIPDSNILMKLLYLIERKAYIDCDRLIFSMSGGYKYIEDKKWDKVISKKKVSFINNGIDLTTFNKNKSTYTYFDEALSNDTNFKVFYVGSIRVANGVKTIIDAAREVYSIDKNVSFYIYGDGNEREELIEYCKKNEMHNVFIKGPVDKKYVPSLLSHSDLNIIHFKNSPLKKYGASLNKLFEYLASGKPIICDCEFYEDIINKNNCGLSVDESNPQELAKIIINFKNMTNEQYDDLMKNCIETSKKYDYPYLTNKLEELIKKDLYLEGETK